MSNSKQTIHKCCARGRPSNTRAALPRQTPPKPPWLHKRATQLHQNAPVQPPGSPGVPWCLLSTKRTRHARDNRVDQDNLNACSRPTNKDRVSDALRSGWEGVGRSLTPHATQVSMGCHHPISLAPSSDRANTNASLTIYP